MKLNNCDRTHRSIDYLAEKSWISVFLGELKGYRAKKRVVEPINSILLNNQA
jgi:hypothetical protein